MARMIVLDANILIALLDAGNSSHGHSRALLEAHTHEQWILSTLTAAEVLVGPARAGRIAEAEAAVNRLGIQVEPLSADAATALAVLRAETGLKMPGCCVLHTAESLGYSLATFDRRLAAAARGRGVTVYE
jgi:predicted nucleic acid-binding protein